LGRPGARAAPAFETLAFTPQGPPLGFLDVQCWRRDPADFGKKSKRHQRPIEEKESHKWPKSYQAVAEVQAHCPGTTLVSVGDREADLYELFQAATATAQGPKLLVRARHDSKLHAEQQRLWETMQSRAADGVQVLQVPRQGQRAARQARPPASRRPHRYVAAAPPRDTIQRVPRDRLWVKIRPRSDGQTNQESSTGGLPFRVQGGLTRWH